MTKNIMFFLFYFSQKGFIIRAPLVRRFLVMISFGLNLVLGYLAMLVAMTYSLELFICVVIGIMFGHFFFNTKTAVGETIDPCCTSQQEATLESSSV